MHKRHSRRLMPTQTIAARREGGGESSQGDRGSRLGCRTKAIVRSPMHETPLTQAPGRRVSGGMEGDDRDGHSPRSALPAQGLVRPEANPPLDPLLALRTVGPGAGETTSTMTRHTPVRWARYSDRR